ncbi:MAG: hypothetical protein AB1563_12005 [Bacillota bacterium]
MTVLKVLRGEGINAAGHATMPKFMGRRGMAVPETVAVVGAGAHGKVVVATLQAAGFTVSGVYDDDPGKWGQKVLGVPVVGSTELLTQGATLPRRGQINFDGRDAAALIDRSGAGPPEDPRAIAATLEEMSVCLGKSLCRWERLDEPGVVPEIVEIGGGGPSRSPGITGVDQKGGNRHRCNRTTEKAR